MAAALEKTDTWQLAAHQLRLTTGSSYEQEQLLEVKTRIRQQLADFTGINFEITIEIKEKIAETITEPQAVRLLKEIFEGEVINNDF